MVAFLPTTCAVVRARGRLVIIGGGRSVRYPGRQSATIRRWAPCAFCRVTTADTRHATVRSAPPWSSRRVATPSAERPSLWRRSKASIGQPAAESRHQNAQRLRIRRSVWSCHRHARLLLNRRSPSRAVHRAIARTPNSRLSRSVSPDRGVVGLTGVGPVGKRGSARRPSAALPRPTETIAAKCSTATSSNAGLGGGRSGRRRRRAVAVFIRPLGVSS